MAVSRQNYRRACNQKNWIRVTGVYRIELVVVCILSVSTKADMYCTFKDTQRQIPTTYWRFRRVSNLPGWFRLHKCDPNSVAGDDRSAHTQKWCATQYDVFTLCRLFIDAARTV